MDRKDPKLIAVEFNEYINKKDLTGLAQLMTDDHAFIDREGKIHQPKNVMIEGWRQFFNEFPDYKNTFTQIESRDNLVAILGYAFWSTKQPYDPVIWTATIVGDLVREWRIYPDTDKNRKKFNLV